MRSQLSGALAVGIAILGVPMAHAGGPTKEAQYYSTRFRVPLSEAVARLALQDSLAEERLEERLKAAFPGEFAGLYVDHEPRHRLVILMRGGRLADVKRHIRTPGLAAIAEVRGARNSAAKLASTMTDAVRVLHLHDLKADVQIDGAANEVQVLALDPRPVIAAFARSRGDFTAVRIKKVPALLRPTALIGGGEWLSTCTTGFSVRFNTYVGVTTAGHCQDVQRWYYNNQELPFQSGTFGGSYDIQWHTAPGHTPTNRIWIGGEYRTITAIKARTSQALGSVVCKYGRSTDYTCGTIISNTYQPSSAVPNATATYVRMGDPNEVQTESGDSGGPVFFGQTAYGSVVGALPVDSYRVDMVYMPADSIQAYGLQIMTY